MDNGKLKIWMELTWWLITAVMIMVVLVYFNPLFVKKDFLVSNVIFIVVALTLSRYIFQMKHTFLADKIYIKILLIFLCIPLVFNVIERIQGFQSFVDLKGLGGFNEYMVPGLGWELQSQIIEIFRLEYMFFGAWAMVAGLLFPIRLIISIWRNYNKAGA